MSKVLLDFLPTEIYHVEYIQSLDSSITSIVLPNWTCNDLKYTAFDFSRFSKVKSIVIGDHCFLSVQTFRIDGLNRLKTIKIGNNSFTQEKNNCESLESIQIGEFSFSDYAGDFELKNLPQLHSIQIGTVGRKSYNFCCNSFVIRGIKAILKM